MTTRLKYLHLSNIKQAKLQFSDKHFAKISHIFQNFVLCSYMYIASPFSKIFVGKTGTALDAISSDIIASYKFCSIKV